MQNLLTGYLIGTTAFSGIFSVWWHKKDLLNLSIKCIFFAQCVAGCMLVYHNYLGG